MEGTAYIRLTAPITILSAQRLLKIIDNKYQQGVRKLHLLMSTPGGNVAEGIYLYNFLKGINMEVITHNFGTVDSIGVILYCAGERRYSVPNARFLLHPVGLDVPKKTRVDENWLSETTKSLEIDQKNIAKIIATTTSRSEDQVLDDIRNRKTLHPDNAKKYGLVTEIDSDLLPVDADFTPIHEADAFPQQHLPNQVIQMASPPPATAAPQIESSIKAYDRGVFGTKYQNPAA